MSGVDSHIPGTDGAKRRTALSAGLQVAIIYLAISAAWIYGSDRVLEHYIEDYAQLTRLQTLKGLFFIAATAALLFGLVAWYVSHALRARRRAEEREALFMRSFDHAVAGMALLDPGGAIQRVNDAFCRTFGYAPEDVVGRNVLELTYPEDRPQREAYLRRQLEGDPPAEPLEVRYLRKDGSVVWVMASSTLHRSSDGAPLMFVSQLVDVTERRQAEEKAAEQRAMLAHGSRLITLGELASSLTHELTQPLTAIAQYADVAVRRLDSGRESVGETMNDAIRGVHEEAERARDIVQRWRAFARRQTPRPLPVDAHELVRDAAKLLTREAAAAGVRLRFEFQSDLPEVRADAIQLEQVLINLMGNAIDSLSQQPEGVPREVVVRTWDAGDSVTVAVCDNGPGIDESVRRRLFEPFFTTKPKGLGLGLPICRTIVQSHGGRLTADRRGPWTEFTFTLPIAPADDRPGQPEERGHAHAMA